ncbi:MAG: phenylalanine--tRNA ligase subunit beta [Candidatus Omnitrophica bacterium]|nr:phenylalanine--tRNA ligase subunit beta [Candidatus Omnitrophota bacterium]
MKYSLSWLKEFIETSLPAEALAERLTLVGCEITAIEKVQGDSIFESEITPNRPDLLSHIGLAREVAAALGREFRPPRWLKRQTRPFVGHGESIRVVIEDHEGCRRYVGIVIEEVRIGESPPEIADRLRRLGIRPVNNVVDITNLCMMELGQPLHAFDLDKLAGPEIQVRRAKPKEKLIAIDGTELQLHPEQTVIADAEKPIALAGVMGGKETEISTGTRRVLLESAWFDPKRIRKSVRLSRLASESSYRFERGVDLVMVQTAAVRAARLICSYAGGTILKGMTDVGHLQMHMRKVTLRPRHAQEVLGMRIYPAQQKKFLQRLGCRVTGTARAWKVEPPSWRSDLRIPEDLYEELARLYGYDRCPATLPPFFRQEVSSKWKPIQDPWLLREAEVRRALTAAGMQEIMTYSLLSEETTARCRLTAARVLQNPLSAEQAVLRVSLLPGALETVARNVNRKASDSFLLFELGRTFSPDEKKTLSLLAAGTTFPRWGIASVPLGFFHLKGVVRFLCDRLRIGPLHETPGDGAPYFQRGTVLQFKIGQESFGSAGLIDPAVAGAFEIPAGFPVAYAELDMELFAKVAQDPLMVRPLAKVAPVARDMAVLLPERSVYENLVSVIEEAGRPLLKSVQLFDLYKGKQVPAGKISLAFRLHYADADRTLTDEEIAAAHAAITRAVQEKCGAVLRI